jgi:hypothetical protein
MSRASDAELRARDSLVLLALLPCNKRVHRLRTPHNGMEFSCQCHPQRLEPVAMLSRHADSRDREIAEGTIPTAMLQYHAHGQLSLGNGQ